MRFALLLTLLISGSAARADELLVYAAASTTEAATAAADAFTKRTGHTVRFSFAGSNDLARQISAGAPADVFLSADLAKMNALEKAGVVNAKDRVNLLSNELVVVVPKNSRRQIKAAADLTTVTKLALADPISVPAGIYAKAWLERVKLWNELEKSLVPTLDVRAALAAVAAGRVDAAIIYRTDATTSAEVRIAFAIPRSEGPEIIYPVAALKKSKHAELAKSFVAFLQNDESREAFEARGFIFLPAIRK